MKNRSVPIFCALVLVSAAEVWAQATNGAYTLVQEIVSSGGGKIGGGNPMSAQATIGLPVSGAASNGTFGLVGGLTMTQAHAPASITMPMTVSGTVDDPAATVKVNGIQASILGNAFTANNVLLSLGPNTITAVATDSFGNTSQKSVVVYLDLPEQKKTSRFSVEVRGTVNDPSATVSVNGVAATITAGQFSAMVPLTSGLNTLTATATDVGGNTTTASIRVFVPLPLSFPAMPTVGTVGSPIPSVTTVSAITIGGTKTPGTSIWINGTQVAGLDNATTWTATITLVEGDNELVIVAKDALGTESAAVTINIIVDNLAPVVTFVPPAKTNLNPVPLTGSVDDSRTTVTVNGLTASRTKRTFQVSVPLTLGPNALQVVATSPNGYVTQRAYIVILGTVPAIQAAQPLDKAKLYAGMSATLQVTAQDAESDPVQCRFLLDGTPLNAWGSSASYAWTPLLSHLGPHTLSVEVRDDFGGVNTKPIRIFVVRRPIDHP